LVLPSRTSPAAKTAPHVAGGEDAALRGLQPCVGCDEAALVDAHEAADGIAVGREADEDEDARGRRHSALRSLS
jgi:hypothetical protein